jgi:hypothetical protein
MKTNTKPKEAEYEDDNNSLSIRKFKSSFTGKLLKNGVVIDSFNCIEEFTDVRFKIITNKLCSFYSFIFDFDEEQKEYKMDELGKWNFEFTEYETVLLNMNIGIRTFQIDGISKYYECY